MQKVLTAEQMREVDRLTSERFGIPSILLMENAAQAAARVIIEKLGGSVEGKSILVLCGKGNNGGDGAALARILLTHGAQIHVVLLGSRKETAGDARVNFDICEKLGGEPENGFVFDEIENTQTLLGILDSDRHWACIVDAILGTGLTRPLDGPLAEIIKAIGSRFSSSKPSRVSTPLLVSIDIPTGLSSDSSLVNGAAFDADATITFTAPKPATVLPPASSRNGNLIVANIGSPESLIGLQPSNLFLAESSDAMNWLEMTRFAANSYKNKRGHALIIAGSRNYSGAAVLCGDAAIRSGVGLVTVATPESSVDSIAARVSPEVMVRALAETKSGSVAERAVAQVNEFIKNVDVTAIGSGLSSDEDETKNFVGRLTAERSTPVIIDADGLTALSPWSLSGSSDLPIILTPHEGEFMRLLGTDDRSVIKDRVAAVREFATKNDVILVLKGERVLIGAPEGKVVVNPTGNSGLGKAGNGDTLTGILAGFTAQAVKFDIGIFESVVAAVYFAGLAGDIAEKKYGKRVMTASDVRDCLTEAFAQVKGG